MRRFLAISFTTLALFVSVASMMPVVAHAATPATDNTGAQTATTPTANTLGAFAGVMTFIMGIFAWLVGVASITLDNAVYYTVVTMGTYVKNLTAVGIAWRVLRDVGNIALIFGFLAIGISIILNTEKLGYGQKMLPTLLIVAVFMNFSLFITEAVIDSGNFVATEIYTQINGGNPAGKSNFDLTSAGSSGISGKLMSKLGLATIYSSALKNGSVFQASNTSTIAFMSIILFIITAFVMFSLSFILIARFITLIFLIILAPVGIVGFAVPQLSGLGKQWRDLLVQQTITAPALMLLLYVALLVITDKFFLGFGTTNWAGFVQNGAVTDLTGFAGTILSFLVAMGLMLAVVISAKKLGAVGADMATKVAGKITFGAVAMGMRSTIGSGSRYLAQKIRTSESFGSTKTGRLFAGGLDRGATGSFDIRGTKALGALPFGGINAGEAQKGGYQARRDSTIKAHQAYAKSLGEVIDEKGKTKEEETAHTNAKTALTTATGEHEKAKDEYHKTVQRLSPEIARQKEEVASIEKEKEADEKKLPSMRDSGLSNRLNVAKQNLATNEGTLATISTQFDQTKEQLGTAKEAEKKADGVVNKRKEEAQTKYAGNISGSLKKTLPSWAAFGPGGSVAAKKIIKDATKNPDKEWSKKLRKAMENSEKEGDGKTKAGSTGLIDALKGAGALGSTGAEGK